MPNSLKNSRAQEKNICIEPLTPVISCKNSSNIADLSLQSKRKAVQICSQIQPSNSKSFEIKENDNLAHKQTLNLFNKESIVNIDSIPLDDTSNKSERSSGNDVSFPFENKKSEKGVKKQFQVHKRHRTDYKIKASPDNMSGMSFNRKSMVRGTTVAGNFHCDTIKSIHLMSEDHEQDESIITDLKQIINKYKMEKTKPS